ncbi:MAG: Mut7-C RNAse domain-containing protein [Burkholderiales bacterium]|jgi:uncharacterized protein with PIN domain|nr:Mut7-C RNAse domain-containing protein [Burkholderiales bacterium]
MNPPRFLCDVMLARLARWLRAAGHDTLLAGAQAPDGELVRRAVAEGRWLITLDRQMAAHKAGQAQVIVLAQGSLAEQAARLGRLIDIDWLARPFSRCLLDNTLLEPARPGDIDRLPEGVRRAARDFLTCPVCERVYWAGSHYRRMAATLAAWQRARQAPPALGALPDAGVFRGTAP